MKKESTLLITLFISMILLVSACSKNGPIRTEKGEIGKPCSTQWFEFTVKSIEKVDSYAGYKPKDGYELYTVLLNEKGTFDVEIPMGTFDFYMDADIFEEYIFPLEPLDDTMMPVEFTLKKDQAVEYRLLYEIPAGTEGLMIGYTEIDEYDKEGVQFTVAVN